MGERLGAHGLARSLLQRVVADRRCGPQAFFDVARLERAALGGVVPPNAGITIGLQLEQHRQGVALRRVRLRRAMHLARGAQQGLQVVTDLVRDDVGLREVARRAEALMQHRVERQVDVGLLVARAIERPHLRASRTAGRRHLVAEQHQLGALVGPTDPLELGRERLLDVVEHPAHEVDELLFFGRRLERLVGLLPATLRDLERHAAARSTTEPEDQREDKPDDATTTADHRARRHATPTIVFEISASTAGLPLHGELLVPCQLQFQVLI